MSKTFRNILALTAFLLIAVAGDARSADIASKDFTADDLFQLAKVRTVELVFTPAEWKAMTPRYGGPQGSGFLLGPEGGRNGFLAARGLTLNWAHAGFTIDGMRFGDIGVRFKGNGTLMAGSQRNKISMKLHLNKYVKGQKLAGLTTLNLANNITDAGWMNEELAYKLFRDAGVPAPRSTYAKVYITVAGEAPRHYAGLFSLIEDVDERFVQDRFGSKTGALLKPVPPSLFTYLGYDWAAYNQTYDPKTELTAEQKARIIEFCKIVSRATDKEFAAKLGDYVDLDNFARFLAVTVWLSDMDGILNVGQNYYAWLEPGPGAGAGRFRFIAWDQDHSFGQMGRASNALNENFSIYRPWSSRNQFLERVFGVPAFRELYLARMREFSKTIFQPARIFRQVDELVPALRPAIAEESDYAVRAFDAVVADPEPGGAAMFGERLKSFVRARTPLVIDQLDGKSEGERVEVGFR